MKMRLIWIGLAAGPLLATAAIWLIFVESGVLERSIAEGAKTAISVLAPPANWAKITVRGREVTLSGEAPNRAAIERATSALEDVTGVRVVRSIARVRSWGNLKTPTVGKLETNDTTPSISGTWQSDIAEGLSVELAGRLYVLGDDVELASKGGSWTLNVPEPLDDGTYDLNVTIWKAEDSAADETDEDLEIDTRPPPAPTVNAVSTNEAKPQISGTWDNREAARLEVRVAESVYRLGQTPELTADGDGNWILRLSEPVPDGTTDVVATAYDAVGNQASDASTGELKIDVTPPIVPTVKSFETTRSFTLEGTWAENDAVELSVKLDGKLYLYKLDPELKSDGNGNWSLVPSSLPGEGQYDVVVTTKDLAGNVSTDTTTNELVIKFKSTEQLGSALEEQPRPLNPYLCQSEFNSLLTGSGVEFEGGRAELTRAGKNLVDALAGIAARCPGARIEVGVHTDSVGDFSVNRRLSQARASSVVQHLINRGIDRERLSGVGYGEIRPIATNRTESGRAKNRRVEMFVKQ